MKKYETEEDLRLEGKKVKVICGHRVTKADAGVIVDYFRCTVTRETLFAAQIPSKGELIVDGLQLDSEIVADLAIHFAKLLGFQPGEARPGRDYYDHSFTINNENGDEVASVSGGGFSQRGTFCFSLKGTGCTYAQAGWEQRLYDFFAPLSAKVTRIDLTRDFFEGQYGYQQAVQAYKEGEFSYRGRAPSKMSVGDVIDGHSTTFQVGKRESGKVFRGYDKGHQFKLMDDPWWRAEVELRSNNRIIPLEALIRPASYFAGAYGFCARILEDVQPQSVPTGQKVAEASVERIFRWFERVVAPSLVHISLAEGFDWLTGIAVDQAYRPVPKSLRGISPESIKAGICKALKRFSQTPSVPAGMVAT
jgi:phage replication initiation protein